MISDLISDDIPPQMTNWNMVILILMYFVEIYTSKSCICLKIIPALATYIYYVDQS